MKILVAIVTCHNYRHRADAQRETWVRDIPARIDHKFFLGRGPLSPLPDEVHLDVEDDYKSLPAKVQAMRAWARQQGYDFIFKCDCDVYVQPLRLLSSDFEHHDYAGRLRGPSGRYRAPYASGFAYWTSARANRLLVEAKLTDDPAEDRWTGNTLLEAGIICRADYRYAVCSSVVNAPSAREGPRGGNRIIAACEYEPEAMHRIHQEWLTLPATADRPITSGHLSNVCILIKTFLRDGALIKCVQSIQRHLPECRMIIVDDGYECHFKITLYAELRAAGHTCIWLPFDSGFGAKSNAAIPHLDRQYTLIASDDFEFNKEVRLGIEKMTHVLEHLPQDVVMASGRVSNRPYEHSLEIVGDTVIESPSKDYGLHDAAGVDFQYCDLSVNYGVIRSKILGFGPGQVHWESDIKIGGGEHGAFFVDLKREGYRVVWVPRANVDEMKLVPGMYHYAYPLFRNRASQPGRLALKRRGINRWQLVDGTVEIT